MANRIDKTYFWGEIEITGLGSQEKESKLNLFITKYEKIYLQRMFGKTLAAALPEEIESLLIDTDALTSPIANFVYYWFMRSEAVVITNAGVKTTTIPNTKNVSPRIKMVQAWNEMVSENIEIQNELEDNEIDYEIDYYNDIYLNINPEDSIFKEINEYDI